MATYNVRVASELSKLIDEQIAKLKDDLAAGLLESMEHYKHITGQVLGLRTSQSLIDEAIAICEGRDHN